MKVAERKLIVLEQVLRILDPDEVSEERIEAFNRAARLYEEWKNYVDEVHGDY